MLDFQSGVDDHLLGITHIIRGIDLQDSAKRQQFVYDYFDWEYPEVLHWGHVQIEAFDVKMSTSTIKRLIDEGELDGWDDPRAPTVAAFRRRGIRGEAITESMVDLGTSTSDVDLAMSAVYSNNRDLIDDDANRYFFVREDGGDGNRGTVELPITGDAPDEGTPPVHPEHEDRGRRSIPVDDAVLLEAADVPAEDEKVWLKGYGCVQYEDGELRYAKDDIDVVREGDADVVHWVPAGSGTVSARLRTPEGDVTGYAEPAFAGTDVDEMVQFVRVGFARVDAHRDDESVAYFAHE
jgi:glutamyl-tRNA synthetase